MDGTVSQPSQTFGYVLFFTLIIGVGLSSLAFGSELDPVSESDAARADQYSLSASEEELLSRFREPAATKHNMAFRALSGAKLDPQGLVPPALLQKAVAYYEQNVSLLGNRSYLGIIDFSRHSSEKRLFIVDMRSGQVVALHVAHGAGSDRDNDGYAREFGNTSDSNMTSLGFYRTGESYNGAHGKSLRLDGLSDSNSNARKRAIVIHGANYVHDSNSRQGRSWGCPAISMRMRDKVVRLLANGAILYAGLSK